MAKKTNPADDLDAAVERIKAWQKTNTEYKQELALAVSVLEGVAEIMDEPPAVKSHPILSRGMHTQWKKICKTTIARWQEWLKIVEE